MRYIMRESASPRSDLLRWKPVSVENVAEEVDRNLVQSYWSSSVERVVALTYERHSTAARGLVVLADTCGRWTVTRRDLFERADRQARRKEKSAKPDGNFSDSRWHGVSCHEEARLSYRIFAILDPPRCPLDTDERFRRDRKKHIRERYAHYIIVDIV